MHPEELLIRRLMVSASGLIYWVGVWIKARRVRRQIGRWPNLKPRGPKEKALWFGWSVVILGWIGQPLAVGGALAPAFLPGMLRQASFVLGLTLLTLGYAGTLWAYIAMGNAWRIGINAKEKTALVNRGPYQWVRHPIYLFQFVMLTGAALLLPTVLSLAILATHYICARIKAREEEKYLLSLHGEAYRNQVSRTGGFFPRWIRRSPSAADPKAGD